MTLLQIAEELNELGTVPDLLILVGLIAAFALIAWRLSVKHKDEAAASERPAAPVSNVSSPAPATARNSAIIAAITAAVTEYQKNTNKS